MAQRTDLLLVAPATADILAKFARGIADDFLTTLYLATTAPVIVAPAMNVNMWNHAATQENIEKLRARGVKIVNPDEGYLACGMTGAGRLAGQQEIVAAVRETLHAQKDLHDETILITAGPTCEDLDPVRYLTNRSSGKMGYAVAEAAARRGAKVTPRKRAGKSRNSCRASSASTFEPPKKCAAPSWIVSPRPPSRFSPPPSPTIAPPKSQSEKMKRNKEPLTIRLEPTPDILAEAAQTKGDRLIVGFAAETDHVAENARKKLAAKNADLIVANDVTAEGAGFDHDTNIVTLFSRDGRDLALPKLSKSEVAQRILDEVLRLRSSPRRPSFSCMMRSMPARIPDALQKKTFRTT